MLQASLSLCVTLVLCIYTATSANCVHLYIRTQTHTNAAGGPLDFFSQNGIFYFFSYLTTFSAQRGLCLPAWILMFLPSLTCSGPVDGMVRTLYLNVIKWENCKKEKTILIELVSCGRDQILKWSPTVNQTNGTDIACKQW